MKKKADQLVLLGLDTKSKPHAARFPADKETELFKAARLMGFAVGVPKTDELRKMVAKLPAGKFFASGRAFAPRVTELAYARFREGLQLKDIPDEQEEVFGNDEAPPVLSWDEIKKGDVVLFEDRANGGWWPCIVKEVPEAGPITLSWRDFKDLHPFQVHRSSIALIGG